MTERDPFERELGRAMESRPAPAELQRRIGRIPLEHPRPRGGRLAQWRRWFTAASAPWTASLAGALASLAVGFWLGFSGLADTTDAAYDAVSVGSDEELVALVFPSVPTTMGEQQ